MLGLHRNSLFRFISKYDNQYSFSTLNETAKLLATPHVEFDKLFKTVEVELRGNDSAVLNSFVKFAKTAGNHFNIQSQSWNLRKPTHTRYTVLKSVHIYKKHRVQYEFRTYYSFVSYKHLTESTASTLLEYIQRNLPEGVALKATMIELQKLPQHFDIQNKKQIKSN